MTAVKLSIAVAPVAVNAWLSTHKPGTPLLNVSRFTKAEIDQLFKNARCVLRSAPFTLLAAPRAHETARILIVIPRAAANAVNRNRLRRRLKAIFSQEGLCKTLPVDLAFIARKGAAQLPFGDLKKMLTSAAEICSRPS